MKKVFASLLVLLSFSTVSAAPLKYNCFSIDDNEPYGLNKLAVTVVSESTLKIELDVFKIVTETYKLNPDYVGKTKSMENYREFNIINPHYDAYGEGPVTPFYVESELFTGGYQLKKGGQGAFIKTTGAGYSWAKYLCVLQ